MPGELRAFTAKIQNSPEHLAFNGKSHRGLKGRVKPVFKKLWRTPFANVRFKVRYLDLRVLVDSPEVQKQFARHSECSNADKCEFPTWPNEYSRHRYYAKWMSNESLLTCLCPVYTRSSLSNRDESALYFSRSDPFRYPSATFPSSTPHFYVTKSIL